MWLSREAAQDPQRVRVYEKYMEYISNNKNVNRFGKPMVSVTSTQEGTHVSMPEPGIPTQSDRLKIDLLLTSIGDSSVPQYLPWYLLNGPRNNEIYNLAILKMEDGNNAFFPYPRGRNPDSLHSTRMKLRLWQFSVRRMIDY